MKFYIASGLSNKEAVRYVSGRLKDKGYVHTYDWTKNEKPSTLEQLQEIGQHELAGVSEADFLIVLLPGGKGTHIEFGIALGQGQKIYLYSVDEEIINVDTTSSFYQLPEVEKFIGSLEEFVDFLCGDLTL
jgi:nucleoside 2-deoxyribosyltransferase